MIEQALSVLKKGFYDAQLKEIWSGFSGGLTSEEIIVYARPEYSWEQMREIRRGFQQGLSIEQVKIYAKPELEWNQMHNIRKKLLLLIN